MITSPDIFEAVRSWIPTSNALIFTEEQISRLNTTAISFLNIPALRWLNEGHYILQRPLPNIAPLMRIHQDNSLKKHLPNSPLLKHFYHDAALMAYDANPLLYSSAEPFFYPGLVEQTAAFIDSKNYLFHASHFQPPVFHPHSRIGKAYLNYFSEKNHLKGKSQLEHYRFELLNFLFSIGLDWDFQEHPTYSHEPLQDTYLKRRKNYFEKSLQTIEDIPSDTWQKRKRL